MSDAPVPLPVPPVAASSAALYTSVHPVRFADCDPAGIVFFPAYLRMLNAVVEDWLAALGHPWTWLIGEQRMGTPTAQLDSRFHRPSFMGESLVFELRLASLGHSSLVLEHAARVAGELRFSARQVLVATSLDTHRPIAWPDDMRAAMHRFKENA
ncbi:MAG: acyl-CoA thioesterase [Rhodocyclaceae bacterium]